MNKVLIKQNISRILYIAGTLAIALIVLQNIAVKPVSASIFDQVDSAFIKPVYAYCPCDADPQYNECHVGDGCTGCPDDFVCSGGCCVREDPDPSSSQPTSSQPTSSEPTSSDPPATNCSKNVWGDCIGGTKRCVTVDKPACAGGGCACYSNDCSDGSTDECGGSISSSGAGSTSSSSGGVSSSLDPSCPVYTLKSGSINPNYVLPGADVLVSCGYGVDYNCFSVTGGGLSNCTVRTYVNGETVFACKAGTNAGTYTDVKCVSSKSAANKCCVDHQDKLPPYTVMSTAAHFTQRMRVPQGKYIMSVKYRTIIKKGQGAFVDLLCASEDCGNGHKMNSSLAMIPMEVNASYQVQSREVEIPAAGNNKDYKIRIVVADGSETYIDKVSFSGGGKEYVLNGEFKNIRNDVTAVNLDQPYAWGDGSNKIGYYYGMAVNTRSPGVGGSSSSVPGSAPPGGASSGMSVPGATAMKLNLKIKLQGVVKKPKVSSNITVRVKVGGKLLAEPTAYQNVTFSVGDDGVWSGSSNFTLPPGPGYIVYVKGPKHLQKKVCDSAPTEGSGGRYHCGEGKITLAGGDNSVDMSKILHLVGDLPENGAQNGIVDSYDTSFVRQHLQSTKPEDLAIGDLNYDGVIDGQDFALVIASLSVKYDEE